MAYKIVFEDKLEETIKWFEDRADKMPKSVRIDQATVVPDIMFTVERFKRAVKLYADKPCFSGEFEVLFRMKDAVLKDNPELMNDEDE